MSETGYTRGSWPLWDACETVASKLQGLTMPPLCLVQGRVQDLQQTRNVFLVVIDMRRDADGRAGPAPHPVAKRPATGWHRRAAGRRPYPAPAESPPSRSARHRSGGSRGRHIGAIEVGDAVWNVELMALTGNRQEIAWHIRCLRLDGYVALDILDLGCTSEAVGSSLREGLH